MPEKDFDDVVLEVLNDARTKDIPILYIIQIIIVMEDLGLF